MQANASTEQQVTRIFAAGFVSVALLFSTLVLGGEVIDRLPAASEIRSSVEHALQVAKSEMDRGMTDFERALLIASGVPDQALR